MYATGNRNALISQCGPCAVPPPLKITDSEFTRWKMSSAMPMPAEAMSSHASAM